MVNILYKGQNYLLFGNKRIVQGLNEIDDEDFYNLMKHPSFVKRIKDGILSIPKGFPLEPKKVEKKPEEKNISKSKDEIQDVNIEEDSQDDDRLSTKQILKLIQKSNDIEYLKNLLDNDDRQKVKDSAKNRIEFLEDIKK